MCESRRRRGPARSTCASRRRSTCSRESWHADGCGRAACRGRGRACSLAFKSASSASLLARERLRSSTWTHVARLRAACCVLTRGGRISRVTRYSAPRGYLTRLKGTLGYSTGPQATMGSARCSWMHQASPDSVARHCAACIPDVHPGMACVSSVQFKRLEPCRDLVPLASGIAVPSRAPRLFGTRPPSTSLQAHCRQTPHEHAHARSGARGHLLGETFDLGAKQRVLRFQRDDHRVGRRWLRL